MRPYLTFLGLLLFAITSKDASSQDKKALPEFRVQGKKSEHIRSAVGVALKAAPQEGEILLDFSDDSLDYNFDQLIFLFKKFDRSDELKHLATVELVKGKYPELEKAWKPLLVPLDRCIDEQLSIPKTRDNEKKYMEANRRSAAAVDQILQGVAKAKGAKKGAVAAEFDPKSLTFNVRVVTDPPGGRRFYSTVFTYTLMKNLDRLDQAWQEILTDSIELGGNYYFKAHWSTGQSKQYGPHEISSGKQIKLPQ